ncbi:FxsA family protein [Aquamicrobium ahrensii]|uniref:UPF0716 protein FxsA n=1 Tax=Aquamicrobium ahrensii TaxID=469551 RepID=A0ABV2KLZ9_9HYPH
MRVSLLPVFFLLLPLLEIAGFVLVGKQIGALATVGLVMLSTVAGGALLRHQGLGAMNRARAAMDAGKDPGLPLANSAMAVVAAILLIVPGFITSVIGVLILLPPARALFWKMFGRRVVFTSQFGAGGFRREGDSRTIELDSEDFSRDRQSGGRTDENSPWRRLPEE